MATPPMHRRDKYGHGLDEYPEETEHGRLLGFDAVGNAAYADETTVTLAVVAADGSLRVPVRDRRLTRRFPLDDAGLSPVEYVLYFADEVGPWRALVDGTRQRISEAGHDPERVLNDGPFEAEPTALAEQLDESDPVAVGEASGAVRRLAMDEPGAAVPVLSTLLGFLSTAIENRGTADLNDRNPSYERRAAQADVAYAVARIAWGEPDPLYESLDTLLEVAGLDRETDEDHPALASVTDALDLLGREDTERIQLALVDRIVDDDTGRATAALNALYRLEHRYAHGTHPLCANESIRAAVEEASDRDGDVGEAATAVETIHGFHRGGP